MFHAGQQIGIYTLINRIGRGGFGEVWLAERRAKFVTTKVAVKLPLDEQVDYAAIEQEARLWAQASGHPNVLPIIEADDYDGQIVIVSEYAPDGSLEQLLKNSGGSLSVTQAAEQTIGILKGLEFLHSRKIIHRDLKPANILLQSGTPRLADFGISRAMRTTSVSTDIAGTPKYMAPEAFDGKRNIQTDIWSIGVILYQMLVGFVPFQSDNAGELINAVINREPRPMPSFIPSALQKIVTKALAKQPTERYQTAREMREELNDFLITLSQSQVAPTQEAIVVEQIKPRTTPENLFPFTPEKQNEKKEQVKIALTVSNKPRRSKLFFATSITALILTIVGVFFLFDGKVRTTSQTADAPINQPTTAPITVNSSNVSTTKTEPIPFRKGDRWGFSDASRKLLIEAKYDEVKPSSEGLARFKLSGKWGLIHRSGRVVLEPMYDSISSFTEGLALVRICNGKCELYSYTDKWGFIDKTGKVVVEVKYEDAGYFNEGLAWVMTKNKIMFVDETGKTVFTLADKYLLPCTFSEGLAMVKSNIEDNSKVGFTTKVGFIDKTGKTIIAPVWDYDQFKSNKNGVYFTNDCRNSFSGGLAVVKVDGKGMCGSFNSKYGFIDKTGKTIIPAEYIDAFSFAEGLASVKIKTGETKFGNARCGIPTGKWGYIDKSGKTIIPFEYEDAQSFSEGLAAIKSILGWGFIDKSGTIVIVTKYEDVEPFREGLSAVQINGKWGFIDQNGKTVIESKYDSVNQFYEGLALVTLDKKQFYIDRYGIEYYEP